MPSEEQVRELAYAIWERQGRPEGKDAEHFFAAKRILEDQEAAQAHVSQSQEVVAPAPRKTVRRSPRRPKQ